MAKNKLARSVSIIGTGFTPLGRVTDTPELQGMTERELVSWAALDAMEDGGISAQDLDIFYLGMSGPNFGSKIKSAAPHFSDWVGMRYKPSVFHDEGCGSSLVGIQDAMYAVASGACDTALSVCLNINTNAVAESGLPLHIRAPRSHDDVMAAVYAGLDSVYEKVGMPGVLDATVVAYCNAYGVSIDEVDQAFATYLLHQREQVMKNPKALLVKETYKEEAARMGFDDPMEYLLSNRANPKMGTTIRARYLPPTVDGASAVIVCATELAEKYTDKPVEIAGISSASAPQSTWVDFPVIPIERCFQEAYDMAGITDPYNEIEHMQIMDGPPSSVLLASESAGFLPRGEAWKYMRDWKIGIDSDRPINTNGGLCQHGHCYSPSFGTQVAESVSQMRGTAGEHQMENPPKTSAIYGGGGGFNIGTAVLRALW